MASYYGDLSGNSSSSSSSDSNSSDENESVEKELYKNLWSRQCVHLDIDCFYCQCEEIDRDLRKNPRPLAIGQKHIIVTCNYEARRYGVKKLQLRENAMTACPSLLIVEGSDLQRYKRYSRSVYEAFRRSIKDITNELEISISARKGTMDEMMADLSPAVDRVLKGNRATTENNKENVHTLFIFGESATPTKLVEDQTGQETVVSFQGRNFNNHCSTLPLSRRNVHESYGTEHDRQMCVQRLNVASKLVARVCQYIFNETGFYVTSGISVSPFLAKLASDLNKPKSINLLFPWRSSHILYKMPLRKMQLVGGRTMRALDNTLEAFSPSSSSQEEMSVKTVIDLLRIPYESIVKSLEGIQVSQGSCTEQCDFLLHRCRGLDSSKIIDDEGRLPKTISVENSFKRGSVCSMDKVCHALDDLLRRLPLMLNDRTSWAANPELAFPTTIRVTVRLVDRNLVGNKRRPFVTTSKQSRLPVGRALIQEGDSNKQTLLLGQHVTPLLNQLLQFSIKNKDINMTRMNIALTNFQDVPSNNTLAPSPGQSLLFGDAPKRNNVGNSQSPTKRIRFDSNPHTPSNQAGAPSRFTYSIPNVKPNYSSSNRMKATRIDSFFKRR